MASGRVPKRQTDIHGGGPPQADAPSGLRWDDPAAVGCPLLMRFVTP